MRERIDSSVGTHNKREEMKDMCVALGRKCRTPPPGQPGIKLVCRPAPISQSSPAKTFTVSSAFSARFLQQHTFNKQFLEYLLSVFVIQLQVFTSGKNKQIFISKNVSRHSMDFGILQFLTFLIRKGIYVEFKLRLFDFK
jgi:hypothetical protein